MAGEASPDYLAAGARAVPQLLRFAPRTRAIASLREPIARFCSAYANKLADGTLRKHLLRDLGRRRRSAVDARLDGEVSGYRPPTPDALAREAVGALEACPDYDHHWTLDEAADARECYVNPFALHGAYAKYLVEWLEGLPRGQVLVVDYAALARDATAVVEAVAAFAGLALPYPGFDGFDTSLVYNTRANRGTHAQNFRGRVGGAISSLKRPAFANASAFDKSWARELSSDARAALATYYARPNADLRSLLERHGQRPLSWAR